MSLYTKILRTQPYLTNQSCRPLNPSVTEAIRTVPCRRSQGLFKLSAGIEDELVRPNPDQKLPRRNHHRMVEVEPQRSPHRLQQPLWTVLRYALLFDKSPRSGTENPRPRRVVDLVPDLRVGVAELE